MFAPERHQWIEREVASRVRVSFAELRELLRVSAATLRRDLTVLETAGRVVRTHGGVMHPGLLVGEPTLDEKRAARTMKKRRIADRLAGDVPDGAVVLIDGGTTCWEVARRLKLRASLTLITNSVPVLADYRDAKARLIALGGEVRVLSGALVGDGALAWLGELKVDLAILGASGLHRCDGASTTELGERAVKRSMIERATESWLAVDSSKCGRSAGFQFGTWRDFARCYTDEGFPQRMATGVRVIRVPKTNNKTL